MKIGELFIGIGIKGGKEAASTVQSLKKGMGSLKATSLEAKLALAGAVYQLGNLIKNSASAGAGFVRFAGYTGQSIQRLQQWQNAARIAGISTDEMEGSIVSISNAIGKMKLLGDAPGGFFEVAQKVGLDYNAADDPFYVLEKLREYSQRKDIPIGMQNQILGMFPGMGPNLISGMRRGKLDESQLKAASRFGFSDKQAESLNKVSENWQKFLMGLEKEMGKFISEHGTEMITWVKDITNGLMSLAQGLVKLAEALHLFKFIGKGFDVLGNTAETVSDPKKLKSFLDNDANDFEMLLQGLLSSAKEKISGLLGSNQGLLTPSNNVNISVYADGEVAPEKIAAAVRDVLHGEYSGTMSTNPALAGSR